MRTENTDTFPKRRNSLGIIAIVAALLLGVSLITCTLLPLRMERMKEQTPVSAAVENAEAAITPLPDPGDERACAGPIALVARVDQDKSAEEERSEAEHAAAYREAEALLAMGEDQTAYKAFLALGDYQDSRQRVEDIYESVAAPEKLAKAEIGDTVFFGSYEQDANRANGSEWIEWLVLDKEEGRILVISKYGLSSQAFNATNISVTWGHCTLRDFLNRRFLNDAFSEEEQARILTVTVKAEQNPGFNTDSGADTQDKLFLLSVGEADKYFSSDEARRCVPTPNTAAQGACVSTTYEADGQATCWWWLRQPGRRNNLAACIDEDGSIHPSGYENNLDDVAVRPAMWIAIDA